MYRQNAKQKNKPNLILVSFFLSRSSLKPRPKPAQTVCPENLEYAINSQDAKRGTNKKSSELAGVTSREYLQKASGCFNKKIYTRIADLNTPSKMFSADLCHHKNRHKNYIGKWNRATSMPNTSAKTTFKQDIYSRTIFLLQN